MQLKNVIALVTGSWLLSASLSAVDAVDTDNVNQCRVDHPLAVKYRSNIVQIVGKNGDGKSYSGSGILVDCTTLLTVQHNLTDSVDFSRLQSLSYRTGAEPPRSIKPNAKIYEGNWINYARGDIAILFDLEPRQHCIRVPMLQDMGADRIRSVAQNKDEFFLLRVSDIPGVKSCVQKCTSESVASHPGLSEWTQGAVTHDCSTKKGDSGSPIFVKAPNGEYYLVGLHTGGHTEKMNLFAPVDARILSPANLKEVK